jgi:hypothetical protein
MSGLPQLLSKQQPIFVPIDPSLYRASKEANPNKRVPTHLLIPPNRANINFIRNTGKYRTVNPKAFRESKDPLPEYWANFDPKTSKYAEYVTKPQNQQKCGSCFAFAAATVINDVFIFGKKLNFNPNISPLSILSCVIDRDCNSQCGGGDTLCVLDHISRQGVTTNYCMNYEKFCDSTPSCYESVKKAFDENTKIFKAESGIISIPQCGCCPNCKNNFSYYISKPTLNYLDRDHPNAVESVKQQIFENGAAVAGYVVYSNFAKDRSNGKFTKTKGIYIQSENYEGTDPKNINLFLGCHAVSIVGWGVEKSPITLDDGTVLNKTPYWIVRNSWSKEWGNGGYFKMAMYQKINGREINPTTSFEKINNVFITDPETKTTTNYQMGGIITISAVAFEKYNNNSSRCSSKDSCNEPSPLENISPNNGLVSPNNGPVSPNNGPVSPNSGPVSPNSGPVSQKTYSLENNYSKYLYIGIGIASFILVLSLVLSFENEPNEKIYLFKNIKNSI